jgi:hypothetical protein
MRSAGIFSATRQISSNAGAPPRTWQIPDETPYSRANALSSVTILVSPFCSYVMNENGTIGGAGAEKPPA